MSRCGTCNVVLEDGEGMRTHYGSEFHLTNVRRRVEGLRPLSQQEHRFADKDVEGAKLDECGAPLYSCTLCKKTFRSVQTLQAHVRSTAHLMRKEQRIIGRDSEAATMLTSTSLGSAAMGLHRRNNAKKGTGGRADAKQKKTGPKVHAQEREEDTSEVRCMFCGFLSADVESNVDHLERLHQFTIPLTNHCTDKPALLAYLARKINGLMCIVCNERTRSFNSLEALRDHMRETNHERLILSPEYQEFYDVALEDPQEARPVQLEGVRGDELILSHDKANKKRIVLKREAEVPRARPRETEEQNEKRLAILAAEQETRALAKQEQKELIVAQNKEAAWVAKRSGGERHDLQLDVSMRTNKLHPKGYDGNMMFS